MRLALIVATACGSHSAPPATVDTPPASAGESIAPVATCNLTIPPLTGCPSGLSCIIDQPYATIAGTTLTFDLARPASGGPFPFVLLIHGGGFVAGDKTDRRLDALVLAQHGYVAATINYRLMTTSPVTNAFPTQPQDTRCALRYFRAHASQYAIDPERVGVMGTSAGAVLTGMFGTEADVAALDGSCADAAQPVSVKAVVPFYGGFDLRGGAPVGSDAQINALVLTWLGEPPSNPTIEAQASSIVHVDRNDPPFLLVHGDADTLVDPMQSQHMRDALQAGGVPATFLPLAGAAHGFEPFQTAQPYATASCTTLAFFDKYL
jgi:acetyl esterase/lipase